MWTRGRTLTSFNKSRCQFRRSPLRVSRTLESGQGCLKGGEVQSDSDSTHWKSNQTEFGRKGFECKSLGEKFF